MSLAKEDYDSALTTESLTKLRFSAMSEHSSVKGTPEAIREWLTRSQQGSHVNRSAMPDCNRAKTIPATCGLQLSSAFASYDQRPAVGSNFHLFFMTRGKFNTGETMSDIIHNAIQSLKTLAGNEQQIYFKSGEIIALMRGCKEDWKSTLPDRKGSFRTFLIHSGICDLYGLKPASLEQRARVTERFGSFITKQGISVVPSRLVALLPLKAVENAPDVAQGLILEVCQSHVPDSTFKAKITEINGNKAKLECDHINLPNGTVNKREQWIKHTCCNTWQQIG